MIQTLSIRFNWKAIGTNVCTASLGWTLSSLWRVPRHTFIYGGLPYLVVISVTMVTVALPTALMQLSVGQLSQQDAIGMWRAVPFFKGLGFLRLLINLLLSLLTAVYTALTALYFLYGLGNSIPFWDCPDSNTVTDTTSEEILINPLSCEETFITPISDSPEYYIALSLIIFVMWIIFPFLFYSPVKLYKRALYVLGPVITIFAIAAWSGAGSARNLSAAFRKEDWSSLLESNIWHAALAQSLISCHIAGGYLISAGDAIYSDSNVQWTSFLVIISNIVTSWLGALFWHSVTSGTSDEVATIAVLLRLYQTAKEGVLGERWPLVIFFTLLLSGTLTMLTLLYPVYDSLRRGGGPKWRVWSSVGSVGCACAALGVLAGGEAAMSALEDVAVPFFVTLVSVFEILVFLLIYGVKTLVEDIGFLTGEELRRSWVWGWWFGVAVLAPVTGWWVGVAAAPAQLSTEVIALITAADLTVTAIAVFAIVAVANQVQYDILGKLASSFKPSRHWGPRDPITHYYWLTRRDQAGRVSDPDFPGADPNGIHLGQLSGAHSLSDLKITPVTTQRAYSDDWLYTGYRRKFLEVVEGYVQEVQRSKSLDWSLKGRRCKSLDSVV